ncbi:hypothetical protein Tco_1114922 [Tanacetum coccineum]
MELCTNLQNKVIDLEKTKTSQAQEITCLKRRVKRLEKKGGLRTHGLTRLYKVGLSRRVEFSEDEGLGEEDASKQGRIADIDADAGINLVSTHFDADTDMFRVHDLVGDEVVVETEVAFKDVNLSVDEVTLAQLAALKSVKPKADKRSKQLHQQFLHNNHHNSMFRIKVKAKWLNRTCEEMSKKVSINLDQDCLSPSYKAEEAEEERLANETRAKESSKRAGEELEQESIKKQKLDEDKETAELQRLIEVVPDKEEVAMMADEVQRLLSLHHMHKSVDRKI